MTVASHVFGILTHVVQLQLNTLRISSFKFGVLSIQMAHCSFDKVFSYVDTSTGEGSSRSFSKRELHYSSDHPSAKRSRIAGNILGTIAVD